ncbi:deazaflavin-dependent nitroreductase [Kribbella sp. NPDC050124]|uniref:deazaflavin-dependent nitroreductase n=1 Tax=Kribbella sp. NPDC050124 TaxID=3364114 RepID=UPI00379F2C2F
MAVTTPLPGWLKPVNRLVRLLSRVGLPLGTIHVLSVPGRSSGAMRTTPVSPLTVDGKRYILSPVPSSDWVRNAQAAGWGLLAAGRKSTRVRLEEVTDPVEKEAVLRAFPAAVPNGVPFFIHVGAVTSADPDEFAAAAPGSVVFLVV